MDLVNPIRNAPTLAPPIKKRYSHSRTPSVSPTRPYSPLGHDPLLRCLSPTSTLQAFTSASRLSYADSRSPSPRRRTLNATFKNVSDAQKELGSKAAQACLDIRGWTHELEGWEWPGTFEEPEPARKRARMSILSIGSLASRQTADTGEDDEKGEFWGCLPATIVQEYDERLQEISEQLDDIDLEDLKNYTLQAHTGSAESTPKIGLTEQQSDDEDATPGDLRQLDDFTTVVTATILQTLPYVNRLARLLDIWSVRIAILKDIPSFLTDLDRLRRDLDHGWAAVAVSLRKDGVYASLGTGNMEEMQALIDDSMASLGYRLDAFLDLLEGREDVVPDSFLDKFEELEERYAEWVVMAKQRVLGDELKELTHSEETTPRAPSQPFVQSTAPVVMDSIIARSRAISPIIERVKTPTARSSFEERARTPTLLSAADYQERARTPTIYTTPDLIDRAITPTIRDAKAASIISADDTISDRDENKSRLLQEHVKVVRPVHLASTPANDSLTALPQIAVTTEPDLRPQSQRSDKDHSPTRSTRHVPILLPFDGDGSDYQPSLAASSADLRHSQQEVLPPAAAELDSPRAERGTGADSPTDPLLVTNESPTKKTKPAGNAFTRLFKKEKKDNAEPERSPSRKTTAGSLLRRSMSRKRQNKSVDNTVWGGRPGSQSVDLPRPVTQSAERPRPDTSSTTSNQPVYRASMQRDGPFEDRGRSRFDDKDTLKLLDPGNEIIHNAEPERPVTAQQMTIAVPATYQPTRASRSASSPKQLDFPENWPLSAADVGATLGLPDEPVIEEPARPDGVNLRTVRSVAAIDSDEFQKLFIDGFPTVLNETEHDPILDVASAPLSTTELREMANTNDAPAPEPHTSIDPDMTPPTRRTSVPTVTTSMLGSNGRQDDLSVARAMSIEGLRQFDNLTESPSQKYLTSRDTTESTLPILDEAASEDGLTPDSSILHDAEIAYVSAVISTGTPQARHTSQHSDMFDMHAKLSAFPPPPAMPEDETADHMRDDDTFNLLKRASMASIKSHLASEVKSIDIPGKQRHSTKSEAAYESHEPLPPDAGIVSAKNSLQIDRPSSKGVPAVQTQVEESNTNAEQAPAFTSSSGPSSLLQQTVLSRAGSRSGAQSPTSSIDTPNFSRLRSSSVDRSEANPPLNIAMAKRRKAPGLETIKPSGEYEPVEPKRRVVPPVDEFDRHVSEVLEKLPAPIRFRSRLANESSSSSPRSATPDLRPGGPRPRNTVMSRQASGTGGLTLTAVEVSPKKSAAGIKLYHLTQAGRDEPIKLFIRLVGEADRVMVRVGGGWADLADFLTQYAEHHGSRTVSGGGLGFELQSAGTTPAGSRRASGVPPPADRVIITDDSISSPQEPVSAIEGLAELPGSDVEATLLSVNAKLQQSQSGRSQSALGTRSSNGNLRKQKQDDATTERKAKWVNTMLEKARKEMSGESRKGEAFEDMGKIGSTRRVIFRSTSAMNGRK